MDQINIIGAGLAGLSAAITLSEHGICCNLISLQPSERAQSVLAEGGINGALDTMGEGDQTENHFEDTMRGGVFMADPNAVEGLTREAPGILRWLAGLGVPFNRKDGEILLRNFGGQKKKRTAYAKSSTGKIIMSSLVDEARRQEAAGRIRRYPHHEFIRLLTAETEERIRCTGVRLRDVYTGRMMDFSGPVILASGGINGFFPGKTTGTTQNSGEVAATVFAQGVAMGNLEMIQYHPTTIGISGKRCLVTEAARGEGGRLYIEKDGRPWYFMEEKYPELKNLMPRDVVSREMYFVSRREDCRGPVYLDMTGLSDEIWAHKLSDLREELQKYLALDPRDTPVPVEPGIHYFMGGIDTDERHRTSMENLYAAGECTCQYHGANRLGGNSMLGAIYGGKVAARTVIETWTAGEKAGAKAAVRAGEKAVKAAAPEKEEAVKAEVQAGEKAAKAAVQTGETAIWAEIPANSSHDVQEPYGEKASPDLIAGISDILLMGLGIVRNEKEISRALQKLEDLSQQGGYNLRERNRLKLAEAMLRSALLRKESRGAHYREDYPQQNEQYRRMTEAVRRGETVRITFRELPERRTERHADTD